MNLHSKGEEIRRMISKLPTKALRKIAKENELHYSISRKKLVKSIAENVSIEKIKEVFQQYEYGGRVSCFFYMINFPSNFSQTNVLEYLEQNEYVQKLLEKKGQVSYNKPSLRFFKIQNPSIRFLFETLGESFLVDRYSNESGEIYQDEIIPAYRIISILILENGLLEVRSSNSRLAQTIANEIARIFGLNQAINLDFRDTTLEEWTRHALRMRNARMTPLTDIGLSSVQMTAQEDRDLSELSVFNEWLESSELVAIYLQFELEENNVIGCLINLRDGKVSFRSEVGEYEITHVSNLISRVVIGTEESD